MYTDCPSSQTEIFQINTVDDLSSTSVLIQRMAALSHWVYSISAFGLTLSWYFSEWMFHFIAIIHWLPYLTDWHFLNTVPSMTEWVWPTQLLPFLPLPSYLCEWFYHFIALIHQLPSLTDWHLLNENSALNDPVSMTLLNKSLCLSIYVNEFLIWLPSYIDCPPSPTDIFSMNTVASMTERVWPCSTISFVFMWMNFPFDCPLTLTALPHRLTFSQWIQCP